MKGILRTKQAQEMFDNMQSVGSEIQKIAKESPQVASNLCRNIAKAFNEFATDIDNEAQ